MKKKQLLTALAAIGFAATFNANALTFSFLENGIGDLGSNTRNFTESGVTLTATGYGLGPNIVHLWAKNDGGDENGLGLSNDSEHEIKPGSFIQLTVPTSPVTTFDFVIAGSVQSGESAKVYFSPTAGVLGTILIGTLNGVDGSVPIPSIYQNGYIDITAGTGNVLLDGASVTVPSVPDGGLTVALLGGALSLLGFARRKLVA